MICNLVLLLPSHQRSSVTSWAWASTQPLLTPLRKIPSRSFRGLSRGDMERFGIETRGVHETPWFAHHNDSSSILVAGISSRMCNGLQQKKFSGRPQRGEAIAR
jgi:hypothetical protein